MREILFRAWDKTTNKYRKFDGMHDTMIIDESGEIRYYNLQNGSGGDEYILEQFTGLLDKNGVRIFEGDLIYIGESLHVIVWNEKGYWLCKPTKGNTYYYTGRALWFKDTEFPHATVIGNIHDNKELLEVVE